MSALVVFIAFLVVVFLNYRQTRRDAGKQSRGYGHSRQHPYGRSHTHGNNHGGSRNQRATPRGIRVVRTGRDGRSRNDGIMSATVPAGVRDPVGESHADPIPPPWTSPLADAPTPAEQHAREHLEPTLPPADFPLHPSETALHADAHIATTPAVPTPKTTTARRLAFELPKNQDSLKKALLYSEILDKPKALRH